MSRPAPVDVPDLPVAAGRLDPAVLDRWLAALIVNTQDRRIGRWRRTRPGRSDRRGPYGHGVTVRWHDGGGAYAAILNQS